MFHVTLCNSRVVHGGCLLQSQAHAHCVERSNEWSIRLLNSTNRALPESPSRSATSRGTLSTLERSIEQTSLSPAARSDGS